MRVLAGCAVVVAHAHLTSLGVEDVGAMASGVHPVVDDLSRAHAAPRGVLAGSGAGGVGLIPYSEAAGAVRTGVGSVDGDLLGADLSGLIELGVTHDQRSKASLGALAVHEVEHFLCEVAVAGVLGIGEDRYPVAAVGAALVVADANAGSVLIEHTCAEVIVVHPGVDDGVHVVGTGDVVLTDGDVAHVVVSEDSELALAVRADVRIVRGELFGAGVSGGVQIAAAQSQSGDAGLCALGVDTVQKLLFGRSRGCGQREESSDAQSHDAQREHHFDRAADTHFVSHNRSPRCWCQ